MVRRGGMGYRTSAQKTRDRRRQKSIRKQQSKGITNVNTDRYNNWGLPQGAKPPRGQSDTDIQAKDGIIVKKAYVSHIIQHVGRYKSKSFGFTQKSFPMYMIDERNGNWRLHAMTFRLDSRGFGDTKRDLFVRVSGAPDSDKPDSLPWGGVQVAQFERKRDAMDYINATGSKGQKKYRTRDEKVYIVQARHLTDGHSMTFPVTSDMRERVYERTRDGVFRRCNESRSVRYEGVPEKKL